MSTELTDSFFLVLLDWEQALEEVRELTRSAPSSDREAAYVLGCVQQLVARQGVDDRGNNWEALQPFRAWKETRWKQQAEQWAQEQAQPPQEQAAQETPTMTADTETESLQQQYIKAAVRQGVLDELYRITALAMARQQDGKSPQ